LSDQIKQQLREMAKLSVLANRISEIQEKNLKSYPFVFFNDVKSVKIDYDISTVDDDGKMNHGDHFIAYHLEIDGSTPTKVGMDKRFFCIAEATRLLFWSDLKVQVFINGKLSYESQKNG